MRISEIGRRAVLVAALAAMPAVAAAQKQTENVDRTMAFPDKGTLKLKNFSGDVRITAGSGRDIVIKAVRVAEREQLDHIKLDIQSSGSTVTIEANKRDSEWESRKRDNRDNRDNNVVETTFEIQLPASAELDVEVFSSDLDVKGIAGVQKLKTFSGSITVVGARAAVSAETFSGGVDIDVTASGSSPDVTAETFSGGIRARIADNAKGAVQFESFSGSFDSDIPLTLHSSGRRRVNADLPGGSSGRTLKFNTFSGSVRVSK